MPTSEADSLKRVTEPASAETSRAKVAGGGREYFLGFDGLRGFSILCVILSHYLSYSSGSNLVIRGIQRFLEFEPAGVDMFFILSGFLIGTALLQHRDSPNYYKVFWARRAYRILPLYYAWIAPFFVLLFLVPGYGMVWPKGYSALGIVGIYLAFIQNNVVAVLKDIPWVGSSWTLGVEEPFYILAPICVRNIRSKKTMAWIFGTVAALSLLFRFILHSVVGSVNWGSDMAFGAYFWTPSRICAPALGLVLALGWAAPEIKSWLKKHTNLLYISIPLLMAVFALVERADRLGIRHAAILQILFDRTAIVLAALCLVAVVLAHPEGMLTRMMEWPIFKRFGRVSYCIYLTHWGIFWLLARFVVHRGFEDHPWLAIELMPFAFLICWGLSELSWKYFDGPLVKRGQAYRYDRPLQARPAPENAGMDRASQNPAAGFSQRSQVLQ